MQVLLTGGTGFIGQALVPALQAAGHSIIVLSRETHADDTGCRFITSLDHIESAERVDAIINLAGASLAAKRWNDAYKREIVDSRLHTTRDVLALMRRLARPPAVLLNASAIGFYGHAENEELDETAQPLNTGFAQKLCADWENAAQEAQALDTRVCLMRIGVVLDNGGGALAQMAQSFRLGVASWLGSGQQWLSWIHRDDVVAAMLYLLDDDNLAGPFNLTAPGPVTGRMFCDALKAHHRTLLSAGVPAPVMRLLVGEMAGELLLVGQRVVPQALQQAGFEFRHPTIESALEEIYA
ncbi:MAG: TIGR01777 family oxidoreductase [Halioglobus sp.]